MTSSLQQIQAHLEEAHTALTSETMDIAKAAEAAKIAVEEALEAVNTALKSSFQTTTGAISEKQATAYADFIVESSKKDPPMFLVFFYYLGIKQTLLRLINLDPLFFVLPNLYQYLYNQYPKLFLYNF